MLLALHEKVTSAAKDMRNNYNEKTKEEEEKRKGRREMFKPVSVKEEECSINVL